MEFEGFACMDDAPFGSPPKRGLASTRREADNETVGEHIESGLGVAAAKRPRVHNKSFAQDSDTAAQEEQVMAYEDASPAKSDYSGGKGKPLKQEDKICHGCSRVEGISPDFLSRGEKVQWARTHSRGLWCKDCFTVWRTVYSGEQSLSFFPDFLAQGDHRSEFEMNMIGYLSLVKEGDSKVTQQKIDGRVKMLRWVFEALCVNPRSSLVVPLDEALDPDSPYHVTPLRACDLITMVADGKRFIGTFFPMVFSPNDQGAFARPIVRNQAMPMRSKAHLATDQDNDLTNLEKETACSIVFQEEASSDMTLAVQVDPSPAKQSKLARRVQGAVSQCASLFDTFTTGNW